MNHENNKRSTWLRRSTAVAAALVVGTAALSGCTTTSINSPQAASSSARSADVRIDSDVQSALQRLYDVVAGSRQMVANAPGVLVFPKVVGGALIVGANHGQGALLVHGRTAGYYSTTSASVGFQAGAQSQAIIYVFNSAQALQKFQTSDGWTVGADAQVAIANVGANGVVSSQTLGQPVVSFVMNNAGVMGGVSLNGAKITRIAP